MKRVMTATVIRGNGGCQAYVNGVASEELKRQEAHRRFDRMASVALTRAVIDHRDRLREYHRAELNARLCPPVTMARRIKEAVANAWALCWAVVVVGGEALGLWERIDEEEV